MKMKAAVLYEQGLVRPYSTSKPLRIEEVSLDGPGDGEVLVQIAAAGLCHSDLSSISGVRTRKTPTVLGHEAAGVVLETGSAVQRVKAGDHVVAVFVASCGQCRHCANGRVNLCEVSWTSRANGSLLSGARRLRLEGRELNHYSGLSTYAQFAVVSEKSLISIDKTVPLHVAALFGCAVVTGVGAVVNTANVKPGQSAAVVGLGGVGLNCLLGLVASGAYPIFAVDLNPGKLELAKALGATHCLLATEPRIIAELRELSSGGVDFAFEMAGSASAMTLAYEVTCRGGTTVSAGLPDPDKVIACPHAALVSDERSVRGSYMGSCTPDRDIPRFIAMYLAGRLPVDRLHSGSVRFEELNHAFDLLADGEIVRQTLVPNDPA